MVFVGTTNDGSVRYALVWTHGAGDGGETDDAHLVADRVEQVQSAEDLAWLKSPYLRTSIVPNDSAYGLPRGLPAAGYADVPDLHGGYYAARQQLISAGFTPIPTKGEVKRYCAEDLLDHPSTGNCDANVALPEIAGCSGGGFAACHAIWQHGDKFLVVNTIGEPGPGDIDNARWATAADLRRLEDVR